MKEERYWILLSKKIAGEATSAELDQLRVLINENPEWKTTMENLQELWNSRSAKANLARQQKSDDAYLVHINRLKEKVSDFEPVIHEIENEAPTFPVPIKKPFYKRLVTYVVAASLVATIFVVYTSLNDKDTIDNSTRLASLTAVPVNEISIGPGSRTKIQLPDGSQVWVNSGSKLSYANSFKGDTREVQLDGEAYFDVVKDPSHPFIVHTSGIDIKVLGTAFNVKAYDVEPVIEATLIHGSIEVINKTRPGTPKIMLKPHEKLVYNKYPVADPRDQRADIKLADADAYSITIKPLSKNIADSDIIETAWVYNKLVFEDERLEDLALKMEKWYNLKVIVETEKLKNSRVTGSFVNETVEEALKELQFLVSFNYTFKGNEVKILKK